MQYVSQREMKTVLKQGFTLDTVLGWGESGKEMIFICLHLLQSYELAGCHSIASLTDPVLYDLINDLPALLVRLLCDFFGAVFTDLHI